MNKWTKAYKARRLRNTWRLREISSMSSCRRMVLAALGLQDTASTSSWVRYMPLGGRYLERWEWWRCCRLWYSLLPRPILLVWTSCSEFPWENKGRGQGLGFHKGRQSKQSTANRETYTAKYSQPGSLRVSPKKTHAVGVYVAKCISD